jgi:hypothetical protein
MSNETLNPRTETNLLRFDLPAFHVVDLLCQGCFCQDFESTTLPSVLVNRMWELWMSVVICVAVSAELDERASRIQEQGVSKCSARNTRHVLC